MPNRCLPTASDDKSKGRCPTLEAVGARPLYKFVLNDLDLNRWKLNDLSRLDHTSACEINSAIRALLKRVLDASSNQIKPARESVSSLLALLFLIASGAISLDEGRRVAL